LTRFIGTLESSGGVGELERWLETHQKHKKHAYREWLNFDIDHRLTRMALLPPNVLNFLRRFKPKIYDRLRRDGVGGIRYGPEVLRSNGYSPVRVKCIHLQAASWLALRRHPGEEWLEAHGIKQDCGGEMRELCLQ